MRRLLVAVGIGWFAVTMALAVAGGAPRDPQPSRWVVRVLDGVGGSYDGSANDVNDRGQVVGWLTTKRPTRAHGAHSAAFLWQGGQLREFDLHLRGLSSSDAVAVNERGQVLGVSEGYNARGKPLAARVWLWQAGRVRPVVATRSELSNLALNDRGEVIGNIGIGPDSAFFWDDGTFTRVGGSGTVVRGLNNRGQVVGYRGANSSRGARAFVWQAGKMTNLGTLGGRISEAYAINDSSQVVGWSESVRTAVPGVWSRSHAFLWQAGRMTDLGTLGGPISEADAINEHGDVIGRAATRRQQQGSYVEHIFLWHDGKMRDIDPPGLGLRLGSLDNGAYPVALSNNGVALTYRYCCGGPQYGYVSDSVSTMKLPPLSAKGWNMPADINDHGVVVGSARGADGRYHAALWQRRSG